MNLPTLNRRQFLRQSFAFSALATLGTHQTLALAPDPHALHILMIGDWGWGGDLSGQRSVASAMVKYAQQNSRRTEALFMLGDSWYGPLPGGVNDPRWKTQFEDMYPSSVFNCPAYSIMGNHDYQIMPVNKLEAELAYAKQPGTRWTQPALWYTFDFPAKNPIMKVIALDSNVPYGDGSPIKNPHGDEIAFTLKPAQYAEQLTWFEAELAAPRKAPFLVVMGHHPIFSNGPHGDTHALGRDWEPLLRKYNAHVYLAGHDHDLQHIEFEGHPTSFISSGAGGADLYNIRIPESQRGPYAEKVHGFTHLEATHDKLSFRHIDAEGHLVHSMTKTPDGKIALS
jgi:tartrate-resistant acid phosphatase type 5